MSVDLAPEPCDTTTAPDLPPTPFDCRQHEMWDCRGQGPSPAALWTADNVPTRSYL